MLSILSNEEGGTIAAANQRQLNMSFNGISSLVSVKLDSVIVYSLSCREKTMNLLALMLIISC